MYRRKMPVSPPTFRRTLWAIPRAWHLSSLDAPTLAITWCLAFARMAHARALPSTALFLGLVTWLCYVGDRLLDGRPSRRSSQLRARHRFYNALWKARRPQLFVAVTLVAITAGLLAFQQLPPMLVVAYGALTVVALAYFAVIHAARQSSWIAKEAVVGVVFAAACVLPIAIADAPRATLLVPSSVLLGGLGWLNCVLIERWEGHGTVDARAHGSTRWASRHVTALLPIGAVSSMVLAGLEHRDPNGAALLLCLAAAFVILAVIERHRRSLSVDALRILADAALLTPLPWLVVRRHA